MFYSFLIFNFEHKDGSHDKQDYHRRPGGNDKVKSEKFFISPLEVF